MAGNHDPWRKSKWSTLVVCNKFCPGRNRARPSLQCVVCKAFYHPECIFFNSKDVKRIKDTYTCTKCCLANDPDALKIRIKTVDLCPILKLSFDCLVGIFSFLPLTDLCSVSCVCSTWKYVAAQPSLWKRISFNSVSVKDWDMAEKWLTLNSIERLDFRGMVLQHKKDTVWHKITDILHNMEYLKHLDFGQVPSGVLHDIVGSLQSLEVLTAEWIIDVDRDTDAWGKNARIDIGKFSHLKNLKELRLRAASTGLQLPMFAFSGGMKDLKELNHLKKLALTTFKGLNSHDFEFLQYLKELEELELGDCLEWETETYEMLGQATELRHLRLENGGTIPDTGLLLAFSSLKNLVHLELVMFRMPETFGDALLAMPHLKSLSLWPDTRDEHGAHVNANCLSAVTFLKQLQLLDWGVLTEEEEEAKDIAQNYFSYCESLTKKDQPIIIFSKELQLSQSQLKNVQTKQDIGTGNIMISAPQLKIFLSNILSSTYVRVFPVPINAVQRLYFIL